MGIVTGLILAGLAALLAWRLSRKARFSGHLCVWLWSSAFAVLGGGVLLGVFHILLGGLLQGATRDVLMRFTVSMWLVAHALLLAGALLAYCAGRVLWGGLSGVLLKLAIFLVVIGWAPSADVIMFDGVVTSIALLTLCTYGAWTWKYPHGQWIVAGAIVWLFAAVLHQGKVGGGSWVAPGDIFNVMYCAVLSLMVRGGWHLRDLADTPGRLAFRRVGWRT